MFCYPDEALAAKYAAESSRTTHGAAECGQVAGAYYGASGIPESWLERLAMRQQIADLAHRLFVVGGTGRWTNFCG
jgi:ADP-ribosyl-[dinitrogen reductase] hydrolase